MTIHEPIIIWWDQTTINYINSEIVHINYKKAASKASDSKSLPISLVDIIISQHGIHNDIDNAS